MLIFQKHKSSAICHIQQHLSKCFSEAILLNVTTWKVSECGKIQTRKTLNVDTFYAVRVYKWFWLKMLFRGIMCFEFPLVRGKLEHYEHMYSAKRFEGANLSDFSRWYIDCRVFQLMDLKWNWISKVLFKITS